MLGREVIQPVHLLMGNLPDCLHSQEPSDWCFHLANRLSKAHHHARQNLQEAQLRQKRDNDMRLVEHHYNPGDIKVGQSSELRPPWTGPYLVISCNAPLYTIRHQKKEQVLHHDRLKLCKDRDISMWLRRLRHRYFQNKFEAIALDDLDLTQPAKEQDQEEGPNECQDLHKTKVNDDEVNDDESDAPVQTLHGKSVKAPSKYKDFV